MFSPTLGVARPTSALSARTFMPTRKTSEPHLLGYDAVHLLAGRQSTIRETRGCHLLANASAAGPVADERLHFRGGTCRGLPHRRFTGCRRITALVTERGFRNCSIYDRNRGSLRADSRDSRSAVGRCHSFGLRRSGRNRPVLHERPTAPGQIRSRYSVHRAAG